MLRKTYNSMAIVTGVDEAALHQRKQTGRFPCYNIGVIPQCQWSDSTRVGHRLVEAQSPHSTRMLDL